MPPKSITADASALDSAHWSLARRDAQLIQIVDAALADATSRAGQHLACRPGCTQCCYGAFAIGPLDALRLRNAMAEMAAANPTQAVIIAERANQYLSDFGPNFPGDRTTGILGTSDEDQAAFEDFANDAPCPVLNPASGLCDLYAARPMTCRVFGPPVRTIATENKDESEAQEGLSICELCFTQATPEEIAAAEMHVPHEEERRVLAQLAKEQPGASGETIIAYCLTLP